MTKRPRDTAELARLVVDMATGEIPNDKDEVLAAIGTQTSPSGEQPQAHLIKESTQCMTRLVAYSRTARSRSSYPALDHHGVMFELNQPPTGESTHVLYVQVHTPGIKAAFERGACKQMVAEAAQVLTALLDDIRKQLRDYIELPLS